jgi:phosphatidylserine/phosphatidylglycerophosphate/cardiolipin synthase-like enzyme
MQRQRAPRAILVHVLLASLVVVAAFGLAGRVVPDAPVEAKEDPVLIVPFFSPGGAVEDALMKEIDAAKKEVLVAMYTFTSRPLALALARAKERGADVKVVLDDGQKGIRYGKYKDLVDRKLDVRVLKLGKTGDNIPIKLHHKFVIVDGLVVGTGSFNWTSQADEENYENVVVIRSRATAKAFREEFTKLWDLAGKNP